MRPQFERTFEEFANACNQILAVAKDEDCWNTTKLHHLTYYAVKASTGLKANHVCQAIRRVIDNSKATRKIKKFRPTSVSLDARTFVFYEDEWKVGITLISGRVNFDLVIGNYQRVRSNVQRKRTRSSRKLLRRLSGRERRFQSWVNHNISRLVGK
jgi:hypothetical protein